jgi:hypothetical protein
MKTNLLIIPAGPNALFQQWGDYSNCNFDLVVLNWTSAPLTNLEHAAYVETTPGQKWKIVADFAGKQDLSQYEYIWILDDDCLTTPEGVEATFNFCKEHNLDMAQPALTPDSFRTHPSTFLIPGAKMHITDTVEIMCPIFSQRAWPECSEHFGKMPAGVGYGLEGYWAGVLDSKSGTTKFGGRVAVIDLYPVRHVKTVTGPAEYARMGIDPNDDGRYFQQLGFGWSFNTIEVVT